VETLKNVYKPISTVATYFHFSSRLYDPLKYLVSFTQMPITLWSILYLSLICHHILCQCVRLLVPLPATKPSTSLASVNLPGAYAPASTALPMITAHKPHHRVQAVTQRDSRILHTKKFNKYFVHKTEFSVQYITS
jgi:hypothetical protein